MERYFLVFYIYIYNGGMGYGENVVKVENGGFLNRRIFQKYTIKDIKTVKITSVIITFIKDITEKESEEYLK